MFDDPERWFANFDVLISRIKRVVHDNADPNAIWEAIDYIGLSNREQQTWDDLMTSKEMLAPCIRAVRFIESMNPRTAGVGAVKWIAQAAYSLLRLQGWTGFAESLTARPLVSKLRLQVQLICLRDAFCDPTELDKVINLLLSDGIRHVNFQKPKIFVQFYADRLAERIACAGAPKIWPMDEPIQCHAMLPLVVKALDYALESKNKNRRSIVGFLRQVGDKEVIDSLDHVSRELRDVERRLKRIQNGFGRVERVPPEWKEKKFKNRLLEKALSYVLTSREKTQIACLGSLLERLLSLDTSSLLDAANEWLAVTKSSRYVSYAFLRALLDADESVNPNETSRKINHLKAQLLRRLSNALRRSKSPARLIEILNIPISSSNCATLTLFERWISPYRDALRDANHDSHPLSLDTFIEFLVLLSNDPDLSLREVIVCCLAEIRAATSDTQHALRLVRLLNDDQRFESTFDETDILAIYPFATNDRERADLLFAMTENSINTDELLLLHPLAESPHGCRLIQQWILKNAGQKIERLVAVVIALKKMAKRFNPFFFVTDSKAWIGDYPETLHHALHSLSEVADNAEEIAKRVLASDFVDRDKLTQELSFLKDKLGGAGLSQDESIRLHKRYNSIEHLLRVVPTVSPARLKNLEEKLLARVSFEYEKNLFESSGRQLAGALAETGIIVPLDVLVKPEQLALVSAILSSTPDMRKLGLLLFERVVQQRPCPGLEEPENKAFVDQLVTLGIDLSPWLDLDRRQRFSFEGRPDFTLEFARSPMEYFLMGHHFGTCLSLTGNNFFSTIANAVDINKQVVYGREDGGRIVGRCLLALGARGELLRYTAYSHDSKPDFENAIESFVASLTVDMKTVRSTSALVRNLVASRWYDDGAVESRGSDIRQAGNEFQAFLESQTDSEIPTELQMTTLKNLIAGVLKEEDATQLAGKTLLHLSNKSPGSKQIPGWVLEIVWLGIQKNGATVDTKLRLAIAAQRAGQPKLLDELMDEMTRYHILKLFLRDRCQEPNCACNRIGHIGSKDDVYEILRRVDPHIALEVIRTGRRRNVRNDLEEVDSDRRSLLASFHERLGRKNLPEQLRQQR